MFWFILGFIVFVISVICICRDDYYDLLEKFLYSVVALLTTIGLSLIFLLISSLIVSPFIEIDYQMVSDTKIIALKDNQNINGTHYIFSGYVDEDLYYYYATETDFGYKTDKAKADDSYIKYTNKETHIETYEPRFTNKIANFFLIPISNNRYIIYCPEDTITTEFNIDLE